MATLSKVRTPEGLTLQVSELVHQPLWSTVEHSGAGRLNYTAFGYKVGERVPGSGSMPGGARNATESDTNLTRRRKINQDESFFLYALTFEAFQIVDESGAGAGPFHPMPVAAAVLSAIQRTTMVNLHVGAHIEKPTLQYPFAYLHESLAPELQGPSAASALAPGFANRPGAQQQNKLKLRVYIGGYGENGKVGNANHFELRWFRPDGLNGPSGSNLRVRFILDGLYKRPA